MYEDEYKTIVKYSYNDDILTSFEVVKRTIEEIAKLEDSNCDFFKFCNKFVLQLCVVMEQLNKADSMFPGADTSHKKILDILSKFTAFVNNKYNMFYQETCEQLHNEVEILDSLFEKPKLKHFVYISKLPSHILKYIEELDIYYDKYLLYVKNHKSVDMEDDLKLLNKLISYYGILYEEGNSDFILLSLKNSLEIFKNCLVKSLQKLTAQELIELDIDIDVLNTKLKIDYGINELNIRDFT